MSVYIGGKLIRNGRIFDQWLIKTDLIENQTFRDNQRLYAQDAYAYK